MRRTAAFLAGTLACAGLGATPAGTSPALPAGTIWVTERSTPATVSALDSATGSTLGVMTAGAGPIGVTAPWRTGKVYSSDEDSNQLSVIDKSTMTVIGTISMGAGSRPHHLMASRDGRYVFVGEYGSNRIGVVDTQLDLNVRDLVASSNPSAKTHAVWVSASGRYVYAANEASPSGTFSKIDVQSGVLIWETPVGVRPSEVLVDGDTAYVSVRNEHVVRQYDLSGCEPVLLGSAQATFLPDTLSLTTDRRTLIVGLRGTPARMAFIDTSTLATTYLQLPGLTTGHQWLSRNGRFTFIALESPGQIGVVDNHLHQLVTTYPYPNGLTKPHGVFFDPAVTDSAGLEEEEPTER